MKKLSRLQIAELRRRLVEWQTPEEMESVIAPITSDVWFNQGGLEFLRDAWVAANFGRLRHAHSIRLVRDVWPDFEIRVDDLVERFESVEALDPKRRRGDEYRTVDETPRSDPVERWIADAEAAPGWVEAVCQTKAAKRYSMRAHLMIYLNFGEYGIRYKEVRAALPSATRSVRDCFQSVWVLWQQEIIPVWSNGEPSEPHTRRVA